MVESVTDATVAPPAPRRIAAFFDLDKTVIAKSSILAFTGPFLAEGLLSRRAVLAASYAQLIYTLSAADRNRVDRMREHIARMCQGWDVRQVQSVVSETFDEIVPPMVFAEAMDLIADHRSRGHDVIVVSASGEEVVAPIARALGASSSIGSRMRIVDGRYAGELDFYCFGEAKAEAIREVAESEGYDLARSYGYSDSATDIPMLKAVGHPRAVNPDRPLRRFANENDWPVMMFTRRVPLSRRVTPAMIGAAGLAAVAVGALIALGGMIVRARRNTSAQGLADAESTGYK